MPSSLFDNGFNACHSGDSLLALLSYIPIRKAIKPVTLFM